MLVAGVQEQFGLVGRFDERSGCLEVFVEELVAVLTVHLDGNAGRPRVAELGEREARGDEQGSAGAGTRLRELLRGHHSERDAGVHHLRREGVRRCDAAPAERAEAGLARERHAFLERVERAAVEEIRRVHGVAPLAQLVGERPDTLRQSLNVVEQHDLSHCDHSSAIDPLSWNILGC